MTQTLTGPEQLAAVASELSFHTRGFVLAALLERAGSVVPSRNILPVLKNFQVSVQDFEGAAPDRLRVVATDLELSVIASTSLVMVEQEGVAVLPAKKMLEISRSAPEGDIFVRVANSVATVSVGRTRWELRLVPAIDYPQLPDVSALTFVDLDRPGLIDAIAAVRYAAATDNRPTLMMIDISSDGQATACDGTRLQRAEVPGWPAAVDGQPFGVQIPIGAVDDLMRLLKGTEAPVIGLASDEHRLVFRIGEDLFLVNKLAAQFPDVESMLLRPALANEDELTVDRGQLLDAVRRVRINADSESSALVLDLEPGVLTVRSKDKSGNQATEDLDVGWSKGTRQVVINHAFLTDMVSAMPTGSTCHFKLGTDGKRRQRPAVMLTQPGSETVGLMSQMRASWVTE